MLRGWSPLCSCPLGGRQRGATCGSGARTRDVGNVARVFEEMKRDRTRCVHSSPDCRLWSVLSENVNYKGKRAELAKLRAAELNMISNIILWVTRSKMALIFETPWANHLVRTRLITALIERTDTTLLRVDSCSVGSLAKKSFAFVFIGFSERSLRPLQGLTCAHEAGHKAQSIGPNAQGRQSWDPHAAPYRPRARQASSRRDDIDCTLE